MSNFAILATTFVLSGPAGPPARPAAQAAKPSVTRITVRAASDVAGKTFTIGEIADVSGAGPALTAQVAAVEAGASPLPGLSRPITRADILLRLRYNKIDTSRVDIVCPPGASVARAASEVPNAAILKAATDAITALPDSAPGDRVVEALPLTNRLFVSPGKLEYRAGEPHGQLLGGMATVPITVLVDGIPAKSVDVPVKIRRTVTALVAARALQPHEILTAADFSTAAVDVTSPGRTLLTDAAAAIGKRTTRSVALGAPLTEASIESAPIVVTGARLMIEITVGGVKISAPAVARTPGAAGDTIRVFTVDTRKELTGIVVDADTVRVEESQ